MNKINSSIPPSSTNSECGLDLSRPLHPTSSKPSTQYQRLPESGCKGLEKAPECPKSDHIGHESVTPYSKITAGIGTIECRNYRNKFFEKFPSVSMLVAQKYKRVSLERDYVHANRLLNEFASQLQIRDLNLSSDTNKLKTFASMKSFQCIRYFSELTFSNALQKCKSLAIDYGLEFNVSGEEVVVQEYYCSEDVWYRKVTTKAKQIIEHVRRQCDAIHKSSSAYSSVDALNNYEQSKLEQDKFLSSKYIKNELGQVYSLKDIASKNVSNPHIRRSEMMVRIKGLEQVASISNHVGDFYTLTTPSRMHSHYKSGKTNPKYDGSTAKDANNYLQKTWTQIRAKLDRLNIRIYGLRVVEPHHDSTPHWHLMLFMRKEDKHQVRSTIEYYAMKSDSSEAGASTHRYTCVPIDAQKGSAAGYIAKYIAKNIDGEYIGKDKYGLDAKASARKITAWASLYKIRQFQFIGGPSITLWRELRKAEKTDNKVLEQVRKAADESDFAAFVIAMGGTNIPKSDRPISLLYKSTNESIDFDTGEIVLNQTKTSTLSGFLVDGDLVEIKKHLWVICDEPPVSEALPAAVRAGSQWRNCKGGNNHAISIGQSPPKRDALLGLV